jgi:hypothetical protein
MTKLGASVSSLFHERRMGRIKQWLKIKNPMARQ